jgi:hypothetical protein
MVGPVGPAGAAVELPHNRDNVGENPRWPWVGYQSRQNSLPSGSRMVRKPNSIGGAGSTR